MDALQRSKMSSGSLNRNFGRGIKLMNFWDMLTVTNNAHRLIDEVGYERRAV